MSPLRTGKVGRAENGSNGRAPADEAAARKLAATGLIETHDAVFRRTARRYSICAADSEDAYQRALEILLTKAPPIEGDALVRWMQTVTKREALAVRRQRERLLSAPRSKDDEERDPLDAIASESPEPNDRAVSRERVARSNEALRALKPQEVRALTLKAEGYSYTEIGEITGWTYTKINRCMAEGRKRFLQVFAELEQGRRCNEVAAALSAVADGEAGGREAEAVEIHLRSCGACRAKLRAFRAIPHRVLELMPGPCLGPVARRPSARVARGAGRRLRRQGSGGRLCGAHSRGGEDAARVASSGGTRGVGMAALAKVLRLRCDCGRECDLCRHRDRRCRRGGNRVQRSPAPVARADRVEHPIDQRRSSLRMRPTTPLLWRPSQPRHRSPRTQQTEQELGFESAAPPAPTGGEFGGAGGRASGGGGSGGGGSGGFGIE